MIPDALYEDYDSALMENVSRCRSTLLKLVANLGTGNVDAMRDALIAAYPRLVSMFGSIAAQVTQEFYQNLRLSQVGAYLPQEAVPVPHFDDDVAIADVRREIGGMYSGKTTADAFASKIGDLAEKRVMQASDDMLEALANADPKNPKVALVPHPGACAWCVMIGSRGFTNNEDAMGNMRHDGCKCTTVVDFDKDNPALKGYDPNKYYEIYRQAATRENDHRFLEDWQSMPLAERQRYVKRVRDPHTGKVKEYKGSWSAYKRNRTVQEMRRVMQGD